MDLNLDPIAFTLGPVAVHWYGIFMAVSILVGFYYFRRDALRLGHDEDFLYNLAFIMVIGGVIGARLVYVLTNWSDYAVEPINILRIRQGGLSFHGGMIGGAIPGWLYIRAKGKRVGQLFDLIVPGVCVGIILVRIGNLINGEVLGRTTEIGLDRHPAQIYASFLGLVLLIIHNVIAPPAARGVSVVVVYFVLQPIPGPHRGDGAQNPLYWPVYLNETYGIGLFTLTHLITPPLLVLAWWMRRRIAVTYATAHKRRRRR